RQENSGIRQEFAAAHAETRRHIDVRVERLHNEIGLVAESVVVLSEKLDREIAGVRADMREGFAETHALIRLSYGDLDRRVRTLEQPRS
ncbi:MAG TPA: hypothetical protein VM779_02705, partial [Thermoanaerobaculia bacterium]|nr:hypothetical protein [Thermoanaerobaculia bacterium]